jgi:hypothetical protein
LDLLSVYRFRSLDGPEKPRLTHTISTALQKHNGLRLANANGCIRLAIEV